MGNGLKSETIDLEALSNEYEKIRYKYTTIRIVQTQSHSSTC